MLNTAAASAAVVPGLLPAVCPCWLDRLDSGGPFTATGCALGAASGVAGVRGIGVTSLAEMPGALDAHLVRRVSASPPREASLSADAAALPGARLSVVIRLAPLALRLPAAVAVFAWYRVAVRWGWTVKVARVGGWNREVTAAPAGQRGKRLPTLLYDSCASFSCQWSTAMCQRNQLFLLYCTLLKTGLEIAVRINTAPPNLVVKPPDHLVVALQRLTRLRQLAL